MWRKSATIVYSVRWQINWLIICCFTSHSRIFHLYGDVTITGEGLQNLGLCSLLSAFEQGGIFIVPHLLYTGPRLFWSHPKDHKYLMLVLWKVKVVFVTAKGQCYLSC
jgi:hypothetical protein